jgi:ligand-binding sensor domain-containing protein
MYKVNDLDLIAWWISSQLVAIINLMLRLVRQLDRRRALIAIGWLISLVAVIVLIYIARVGRRIEEERRLAAEVSRVEVEQVNWRQAPEGITLYLSSADARALIRWGDRIYLATSGGLCALDDSGRVTRRYTTLDGLPTNDLTALAAFRDRLFIGTADAGLVGFDGKVFTNYRFKRPAASRVSALLPSQGELLIGTLDGGLFEYDGERFRRRLALAAGADFKAVTALLEFNSRIYIGTQDRGLYIWREGRIEKVESGLPSPHITALAALADGRVAVATDFGVVALDQDNQIKLISSHPNVISLAVADGRLWAGLFGGGAYDLADQSKASILTSGLPESAPVRLVWAEGLLWALTTKGVFLKDLSKSRFEAFASQLISDSPLTASHITSLALDGSTRLWVGYFDAGIDIISPDEPELIAHLEDDRTREINYLSFDAARGNILAATSRGLIIFGGASKPPTAIAEVLTRRDGLVNDSVAHVSAVEGGLVLATAGGLTELRGGRARSITAFHGLSSNHLYTCAALGSRLFVGGLAGLIELEGLRVVRTYKTSNSPLSHDWVTALQAAEGVLYIGTMGGLDALLPTGQWINFSAELGRPEVNQNAIHYDGERLYVGTAGHGLLVYNIAAHRWSRVNSGLPSESVTAIVSDDSSLYVGTTGGLARIQKRILR